LYKLYKKRVLQCCVKLHYFFAVSKSIIEAASLIQIAELKDTSILSAYGTNGLTTEHKAAKKALKNLSEINCFFDCDQGGKEGTIRQGVEISIVATPQARKSKIFG
jgi:hypothetical protein